MNGPELIQCVFAPLRNKGIGKLHDLVSEEEVEIDRNCLKRMKMVVVNLPVGLIEYAASYIEDINDFKDSIMRFRSQCKNVKLSHNNMYGRCGEIEAYKHILWGCIGRRKIWQLYNQFIAQNNFLGAKVKEYCDTLVVENIVMLSRVKMRVILEMIKIFRPTNLDAI